MDSVLGKALILWTVRVSVGLYAAALWRLLFHRRAAGPDRVSSALWLGAWAMCVIHVVCAFHFEHHWSHQAALLHTTEMTERVVGLKWGGGLYINYLFLIWWGWDAFRQLSRPGSRVSPVIQAAAVFMMFNATAVFGPVWWWIPVIGFALTLVVYGSLRRPEIIDSADFSSKRS
ncbi:MAG: hypothetical protein RIK87_04705 [Fuerstiella sp.]